MLKHWADLEALRLSIANIQEILSLLQLQVDELRRAIDFRLAPLTEEIEELQQRYDPDANS